MSVTNQELSGIQTAASTSKLTHTHTPSADKKTNSEPSAQVITQKQQSYQKASKNFCYQNLEATRSQFMVNHQQMKSSILKVFRKKRGYMLGA